MSKDYKKLYEDALERAKYLKENIDSVGALDVSTCFEEIFPELKESEDERIRKEIIQFLQLPHPQFVGKRNYEEWIAWLEKQYTKLQEYINEERNKKDFYCEGKEMSWNEMPLGVKKHDYPYYFKGDLDCYPFNTEKQGEQKQIIAVDSDQLLKILPRTVEWSEEDEKHIENIIACLEEFLSPRFPIYRGGIVDEINWLKSLKPSNWKPSEEQMKALKDIIIGKRGPLYDLYFDLEKL